LRAARNLIPMQNTFYAKWLFDEAERATAQALDLPEGTRRKRKYAKRTVKF
jgi:hypothetical protein